MDDFREDRGGKSPASGMEQFRTRISGNNMGFLMGEEHSPRQMVEFLNSGAMFRGFDDVIKSMYPGEDLGARLTKGMEALTGENHDSVARKVRNWLNGRNAPQSRETLFQISFVLGLGEEQASRLLEWWTAWGSTTGTRTSWCTPMPCGRGLAGRRPSG